MISTTVSPGFGSSVACPTAPRSAARASGVVDALVVGIASSGSGPESDAPCTLFWPRSGCRPVPGLADLAGHQRQRDQAARVVGAVHVLRDAHAPQDHRRPSTWRTARATSRIVSASMPQIGAIASGVKPSTFSAQLLVADGAVGDERLVDQAFVDDDVHHRVQQRDVGVGLELQVVGARGAPGRSGAGRRRSACVPFLAAFLIQVAATGWLTVGLAPIRKITSAFGDVASPGSRPRPSRCLPSAPPRSTRGTGACSGRRCCEPKPVRTSFWNR